MADIEFITGQIESEIRVDLHGKGTASIAGTARLSGVTPQNLSRAYNNPTSKLFKFLASKGFDPTTFAETGVPDIAVALTVLYYAYKAGERCTKQAQVANEVFTSVGVRVWMQQVTGWQDPATRRLTTEEVAQICLLPGGRDWKKRFDDDYYTELARLTGLQQFGKSRPPLWGKLTDEWVYQMLPIGVREGVRDSRDEHGGWHKLHQFLSDDGLAIFERHMDSLLIVMKSSESVNGVRRALKTLTRTEYQHRLFDDCRKDGKLTVSRQLRLLNPDNNKTA